jgi:hypothetical protein
MVVQQDADRIRELSPDQFIENLVLVQVHQLGQESTEYFLFGVPIPVADVVGIGRIEGYPQENEAGIVIAFTLFGAIQPTEGAMNAQAQAG